MSTRSPAGIFHSMRNLCAIQTLIILTLATVICSDATWAQSYISGFHRHNVDMKEVQPSWMTPLIGTTPLLGQFVREEFVRQKVAGGDPLWNIGNGKGPSLLLSNRVETDLAIPNYAVHGAAAGTDGVGDFSVTTRYRLFSGNKQHGNFSFTAIGNQSWSTGLVKNGAISWTRAITLAGGKAFGRYAILSTIGATIPATSGLATLGRPIVWNSAFEVHVTPKLWAQLESNATFYNGGTHDGKKQNFMTPGVFLSPMRPWSGKSNAFFLLGVGMQIATSQYHGSDHNLVIDTKIYF
jgi:hypothetical protein